MKIRKATKKDLPEIVEISKGLLDYHVQFAKYYATIKNEKERKKHARKYFGKMIIARNSKMWVAEHKEKIIGYAIAELVKNSPVLKEKYHGHIKEIYVIDKYRGKGIAADFIKEIFAWFKAKKMKRAAVLFDSKNKSAKKAYAKAGFKPFQEKYQIYLK